MKNDLDHLWYWVRSWEGIVGYENCDQRRCEGWPQKRGRSSFLFFVILFKSELLEVASKLCCLKMRWAVLQVMSSPSLMVFKWTALVKPNFQDFFFFGRGFLPQIVSGLNGLKLTYWKRPWCWERLRAEGEGGDKGLDGWMASPSQWTWVWANSGRQWRTGKSGMMQSMGLQRVRHNLATEQQQQNDFQSPSTVQFMQELNFQRKFSFFLSFGYPLFSHCLADFLVLRPESVGTPALISLHWSPGSS